MSAATQLGRLQAALVERGITWERDPEREGIFNTTCVECEAPALLNVLAGTAVYACRNGCTGQAIYARLGVEWEGPPQQLNGAGHPPADERHAPSPDDFFTVGANGRMAFVPRRLGEHLRAEAPVAVGGEELHVYCDGAYRPAGETDLRRRSSELLGEQWRRNHADETIAYLRDSSPALLEAPPLDRVNCGNGILDLETGTLEPHDPDFLTPVQIAAAYDPEATCPAIDAFIAEVLDAEVRRIFFELAAYLIAPDNRLQTAAMFLGGGANGKSTALRVQAEFLGPSNVSAVPLHKLDEDRFATADLYGKLANVFADLDARALRSSSTFKSITGGDAIQAERKFRPAFTFRPYARLLFSANEPPPTPDSSEAFFRRWLVLPFERSFEAREADRNLLARLTTPAELSGLLNRALEELPGLRERGHFTTSDVTSRAATGFRVSADSAAGFLDESCRLEPEGRVAKPTLYRAYKEWCEENGRSPLSARRFHGRIRDLIPADQHDEVTVRGVDQVLGVALKDGQL